ncbi:unnamed protein product [Oppiella nova]|uniref:Uncharacterized protein n=1 Tax=Oppiella nova TaxID=334625 RepID=A0A7R9MHB2_9ACAR|nr:unnamed protein product [Oppiella nova]CAG2177393.1 unnamed protein product [Oppiella nova]
MTKIMVCMFVNFILFSLITCMSCSPNLTTMTTNLCHNSLHLLDNYDNRYGNGYELDHYDPEYEYSQEWHFKIKYHNDYESNEVQYDHNHETHDYYS